MRWRWLLCAFMSMGCDKLDAALPALSLRTSSGPALARPRGASDLEPQQDAEKRKRVAVLRSKMRQRWSFPKLAHGRPLQRCTNETVHVSKDEAITLAFVDAREQTKSLMPRRIAERLESAGLSVVQGQHDDLEGSDSEDLDALQLTLSEWEKRRYVGLFYVTDYAGPALIVRLGELKRSWYPGRLAATFIVYDTQERSPICGYDLRVQNETKEAPIRARLQAETRIRLERELANALRDSARAELARDADSLLGALTSVTQNGNQP
jgi:hypothetical protein